MNEEIHLSWNTRGLGTKDVRRQKSKSLWTAYATKKRNQNLNTIDPLTALKDRRKLENIDDKIKYLKSELKSILEQGCKTDSEIFNYHSNVTCIVPQPCDEFNSNLNSPKHSTVVEKSWNKLSDTGKNLEKTDDKDSQSLNKLNISKKIVLKANKGKISENGAFNTTKESHTSLCSEDSSKFSSWLSATIDSMMIQEKYLDIEEENKNVDRTECKKYNVSEDCVQGFDFKNKYSNLFGLPEHKVAKLLYKSFIVQNSGEFSCDYNSSFKEALIFTKKKTQEKSIFGKEIKKKNYSSKSCRKKDLEVTLASKRKGSNAEYNYKDSSDSDSQTTFTNFKESRNFKKWNFKKKMPDSYLMVESETASSAHDQTVRTNEKNQFSTAFNENNMNEQCSSSKPVANLENQEVKHNKSKTYEWECPICLEQPSGQEVVTTFCGHIFCKKCIENHLRSRKICPSCCNNLQGKPLITLFNFHS